MELGMGQSEQAQRARAAPEWLPLQTLTTVWVWDAQRRKGGVGYGGGLVPPWTGNLGHDAPKYPAEKGPGLFSNFYITHGETEAYVR